MLGLSALIDLLVSRTARRRALTTLEGATFYSASAATVVIATAGANTDGVVIRLAAGHCTGGGGGSLKVDGNLIVELCEEYNGGRTRVVRDLFIPAGVEVAIVSNQAATPVTCYAEVL